MSLCLYQLLPGPFQLFDPCLEVGLHCLQLQPVLVEVPVKIKSRFVNDKKMEGLPFQIGVGPPQLLNFPFVTYTLPLVLLGCSLGVGVALSQLFDFLFHPKG